jgi:hypothetical protein
VLLGVGVDRPKRRGAPGVIGQDYEAADLRGQIGQQLGAVDVIGPGVDLRQHQGSALARLIRRWRQALRDQLVEPRDAHLGPFEPVAHAFELGWVASMQRGEEVDGPALERGARIRPRRADQGLKIDLGCLGLGLGRRFDQRRDVEPVGRGVGEIPAGGQIGRQLDDPHLRRDALERLDDTTGGLPAGLVIVRPEGNLAALERAPIRLADRLGAAGPGDRDERRHALGGRISGFLTLDHEHRIGRAFGEAIEPVQRPRRRHRFPVPFGAAAVQAAIRIGQDLLAVRQIEPGDVEQDRTTHVAVGPGRARLAMASMAKVGARRAGRNRRDHLEVGTAHHGRSRRWSARATAWSARAAVRCRSRQVRTPNARMIAANEHPR